MRINEFLPPSTPCPRSARFRPPSNQYPSIRRWATPKSRRSTIFRPTAIGLTRPTLPIVVAKTTGIGSILNVQYKWDNSKRDANLRKHGVDFWDAIMKTPTGWKTSTYGEERIA